MNRKQAINIVKEVFIKNGYAIEFINSLLDALNGKVYNTFSNLNYFNERLRLNFGSTLGKIPIESEEIKDSDNILAKNPSLKRDTESLVQKSNSIENEFEKLEQENSNPISVAEDIIPDPNEVKDNVNK